MRVIDNKFEKKNYLILPPKSFNYNKEIEVLIKIKFKYKPVIL